MKKVPGFVIMAILFAVLFSPIAGKAMAISQGTVPNFDDAWYDNVLGMPQIGNLIVDAEAVMHVISTDQYFKVKFGTGLPTTVCICPYCGEKQDHDQFFTKAQIEYAESIAVKEVLGPELKKLEKSFKDLERSTRGGFIQIKVKSSGLNFPIKYYQEKELETQIICDSCGLELKVEGVLG